jgi:hypothetical protein
MKAVGQRWLPCLYDVTICIIEKMSPPAPLPPSSEMSETASKVIFKGHEKTYSLAPRLAHF